MNLIDYAEKNAAEQMAGHMEDNNLATKDAQYTFAFIITALSASLGWLIKKIGEAPIDNLANLPVVLGLGALSIHLMILGGYVLRRTLVASEIHHPGNLPANLLREELREIPVDDIRWQACLNLQDRIEKNRARAASTNAVLNRVKRSALWIPITFLAVWWVAALAC